MLEVARQTFDEKLFTRCNLVLFEDEASSVDLFPLSVLRPAWEIRIGMGCTRQWLAELRERDSQAILRSRPQLTRMAELLADSGGEEFDPSAETVFLNGRVFGFWRTEPGSDVEPPTSVFDSEGRLLMARLEGAKVAELLTLRGNPLTEWLVQLCESGGGLSPDWTVRHARYTWEFMSANKELLERQFSSVRNDANMLMNARALREAPTGVHFTERLAGHTAFVAPNVRIMPGAVLGVHTGSIWIGEHTEIEPHTYLEGPLFIGPNCKVKSGARIYHGSSLGPHCRVSGEITESIMQGFVNKQHDGFLGNSHLGQWVNLGADTTNSNLRNDYGQVKVTLGARIVKSERQFIGLLCGDHAKTGINTMFNTATVVGVAANVFGADYPPRYIPSFMWGGAQGLKRASLERTLETARIIMPRRGQELGTAEEQLLRQHYADTNTEEK